LPPPSETRMPSRFNGEREVVAQLKRPNKCEHEQAIAKSGPKFIIITTGEVHKVLECPKRGRSCSPRLGREIIGGPPAAAHDPKEQEDILPAGKCSQVAAKHAMLYG